MRPILVAVLVVAGCTGAAPGVRAAIQRDSVGVLVFHLAPRDAAAPPRVEQIVVASSRRGGRGAAATGFPSYWAVLRLPDAAGIELPASIRYGVLPEGYAVARRPVAPPLPPGSYELDVKTNRGHAVTYFRIGSDGQLR